MLGNDWQNGPRSEMWLRGDLHNLLVAINAANAELSLAVPSSREVAAYRAGFIAALRAVAKGVHVEPPAPAPVIDASRSEPRALPGRVDIGTRPTNEFEAALVGLGPSGLAALREIVDAVARCPDKNTRDRVLDQYLTRIQAGWPGW